MQLSSGSEGKKLSLVAGSTCFIPEEYIAVVVTILS
jgi:hypothetical protein